MNSYLLRIKKTIIPYVLLGIITGLITGFFVYFYNYVIHEVTVWSEYLFALVRKNPAFTPLLIIAAAILSLCIGSIIKFVPEASGSGIPYAEGMVRGKLKPRWYLAIPAMFAASAMSVFMGLSLGSEGPSIFLGALTGYAISAVIKTRLMDQRLIATAGACSGLAIAFNAPLAGIIFSVEEAHRRTSPQILIPAITSVLTSVVTIDFIFGNRTFLHYENLNMPVTAANIAGAAAVGILCGLFAVLFNFSVIKRISFWNKISIQFRVLIPAALSCLLGLFLPASTGAGKNILLDIATYGLGMLALIFCVKYIFTILSNKSGASGGVFIPMLALGALIGAFVSRIMTAVNINNELIYLSLMGAGAFFAASVRAPFTAVILIFEISGFSLSSVIGVMTAVGAGYLVAELFKSKPLYEELLDGILKRNNISDESRSMSEFSVVVEPKASAVGLAIRDLVLPDNCLIVRIARNENVFVPDGETVIKENDSIIIACERIHILDAEREFTRLFTNEVYNALYRKKASKR